MRITPVLGLGCVGKSEDQREWPVVIGGGDEASTSIACFDLPLWSKGKKMRASHTANAAALTGFQRRQGFFSEFSSKELIAISS